MDTHGGERSDYSDSRWTSHPAASGLPADNPVSLHDRSFGDRGNVSDCSHGQHEHHDHRRHHHFDRRYHHDSISEPTNSVGSGGDGTDSSQSHSLPERKRIFSASGLGTPHDSNHGGSIVKLYVAFIPRTATEEDIRSVFGEHGNVVEIVLVKDKRIGQQQEFCFVKYETSFEADRAINALHNKYTFPGIAIPVKVRYADGENERLGVWNPQLHKLYVGCLNKQSSKPEIEDIFSPFGIVEDIYIVIDEMKQHRGCGFVQFSQREMAVAAINALHGTYVMRGCDQPLIVRFANPKKPRVGDSRSNSKFGSPGPPGFGPCSQESFVRQTPYFSDPVGRHMLPINSHPASPKPVRPLHMGSKPLIVPSTSTTVEQGLPATISVTPPVGLSTDTADSLYCDWSEHICPDGYEYYYNCVTNESKWEKPKAYALYEQELEKQLQGHHSYCQELPLLSNQQVSETQKLQLQTQLPNETLQQTSVSAQDLDHVVVQEARTPVVDPACF